LTGARRDPTTRRAGRIRRTVWRSDGGGHQGASAHQGRTARQSLEQILDAAEYLFSQNGLYGVTLRDVAVRVGIHTTLLNYYFKDKVNLFEAVFARRAGVTSGRRMVALEQYEQAAGDKPRPSRARCTPSSIPTSTSITRAASTG
jgi:hypothetical protein